MDLKMNKVYVCQVEGKRRQSEWGGDNVIYLHFEASFKLESAGRCNPMKGRSELETETIIWCFSETLLSCIILLNSSRPALHPWNRMVWALSSALRLLMDIHTYPVTVPFSRKENHFPLSTVQQEMLQSDAQWTTVTFMGQDAHSNASWFSQSGTWDTMTPTCKTPRADRTRAEKTLQQQTLVHE